MVKNVVQNTITDKVLVELESNKIMGSYIAHLDEHTSLVVLGEHPIIYAKNRKLLEELRQETRLGKLVGKIEQVEHIYSTSIDYDLMEEDSLRAFVGRMERIGLQSHPPKYVVALGAGDYGNKVSSLAKLLSSSVQNLPNHYLPSHRILPALPSLEMN